MIGKWSASSCTSELRRASLPRWPPPACSICGKINVTTFKLAEFRQAVEAAALMQGLDLTAMVP